MTKENSNKDEVARHVATGGPVRESVGLGVMNLDGITHLTMTSSAVGRIERVASKEPPDSQQDLQRYLSAAASEIRMRDREIDFLRQQLKIANTALEFYAISEHWSGIYAVDSDCAIAREDTDLDNDSFGLKAKCALQEQVDLLRTCRTCGGQAKIEAEDKGYAVVCSGNPRQHQWSGLHSDLYAAMARWNEIQKPVTRTNRE